MTETIFKTNSVSHIKAAVPDDDWLLQELFEEDSELTDLESGDDTVIESDQYQAVYNDQLQEISPLNPDESENESEDYRCPHINIIRNEFLRNSASIASGYYFIDRDDEKHGGSISVSKQIENGSSFVICRSGVSVEHGCYEIYPHFNFSEFPNVRQFARMFKIFNKFTDEGSSADLINEKIAMIREDIYASGLYTETKRKLADIISASASKDLSLFVISSGQNGPVTADSPANDEDPVSGIMGISDLAGYFACRHFPFVAAEKEKISGGISKLELFVNEKLLVDSGKLHLFRGFFEMLSCRFSEQGKLSKIHPGSYYANLDYEQPVQGKSENQSVRIYKKPAASQNKPECLPMLKDEEYYKNLEAGLKLSGKLI